MYVNLYFKIPTEIVGNFLNRHWPSELGNYFVRKRFAV